MCLGNSMAPKNIFNSILCLVPYTDNPLCTLFYALQCAAWHDPRSCACRHLPVFSRLRSHPRWILDRVWLPRGQQHIGRKSAKEKSRRASELPCHCMAVPSNHHIARLPGAASSWGQRTYFGHCNTTGQWETNGNMMEALQSSIFFESKQCSVGVLFPLKRALASWFGSESWLVVVVGDDSRSGNSTSKRNSNSKTRISSSSRQQQQQQPQQQQEQ